jgi:hypothetical protein
VALRLERLADGRFPGEDWSPHDVPILVAARLLKPLGNPPPNSVKYFAASEVLEQAKDRTWSAKVTNAVNQHWQKKNAAKKTQLPIGHGIGVCEPVEAEVMSLCRRVEDEAWEIATAVRDSGMSKDEALARLRERFSFMSQANLSRTFSQAMYYTLK